MAGSVVFQNNVFIVEVFQVSRGYRMKLVTESCIHRCENWKRNWSAVSPLEWRETIQTLTHSTPPVSFYTLWRRKFRGFQMISGVIEREQWHEMGFKNVRKILFDEIGMICPWYSHDKVMIQPWYNHDTVVIWPWYMHHIVMIWPWYSHAQIQENYWVMELYKVHRFVIF